MEGASFILKHEAIRAAGSDPSQDPVLTMITEEMQEVQEQVKRLWVLMKEQDGGLVQMPREGRAREGGAVPGHVRRGDAIADEVDNSNAEDMGEEDN